MIDWAAVVEFTLLLDAASGIVLATLGIAVAVVARRGRVSDPVLVWALVALLVAWGVFLALRNLDGLVLTDPSLLVGDLFAFVIPPAAVVTALRFPPRSGSGPALLALGILGPLMVARIALDPSEVARLHGIAIFGETHSMWFLVLTLAARAALHGADQGSVALASVAFAPFLALNVGVALARTVRTEPGDALGIGGVVEGMLTLATAVLWLTAAARARDVVARKARNVAWVVLAVPLVGLLFALATDPAFAPDLGIFGLARTVGAAALAYAILRRDILGIDTKLRWGTSKATVAATFIAVFFIVSEGAQEFFGERAGSQYFGILGAGLLVFAIAPLSRLADRLAEKAIPAGGNGDTTRAGHEQAFRAAVRLALRGGITRSEEFELARIAEAHGISPVRALQLRDEVEQAAARRGSSQ